METSVNYKCFKNIVSKFNNLLFFRHVPLDHFDLNIVKLNSYINGIFFANYLKIHYQFKKPIEHDKKISMCRHKNVPRIWHKNI